jgi:hypothetical protein
MKNIGVLIIFLICCFISSAQDIKVKRKFRGIYTGIIPPYEFNSGEELFRVSSAPISITISKTGYLLTIGDLNYEGEIIALSVKKKQAYFTIKIPEYSLEEKVQVDAKKKILLRDGIRPQPILQLRKFKE